MVLIGTNEVGMFEKKKKKMMKICKEVQSYFHGSKGIVVGLLGSKGNVENFKVEGGEGFDII